MCLHRSVLCHRCQQKGNSRGEREKAAGDLTDLMGTVEIGGNQVGTETVAIGEMRVFLSPEEIEETEESVGIEGRTVNQNFQALVGWRAW